MTSFDGAQAYLKTAALRGSRLGLERVSELCSKLGSPQESLPVVHIAGTNGKGSFSAMLCAVLTEAGYRTGSFSTPALTGITDCYRINGTEISPADFAAAMDEVIPQAEAMQDKPTEFEVMAAAAWVLFRQKKCDIALVECCMGGDTDCTNTVSSPLLSVITNVQHDHAAFLGSTLPEIAAHKAGIIKPGRPVLFGGSSKEALDVIREKAGSMGSPLHLTDMGRASGISSGILGISFNWDGLGRISVPLGGEYQLQNSANVLTAAELLRSEGLRISDTHIIKGLSRARWHGRFEVLKSSDPLVIFDGAHNPDGIAMAAESFEKYGISGAVLFIGVMSDKEYGLYGDMLGKYASRAYTSVPDNPRALPAEALAAALREHGIEAFPCAELEAGVQEAYEYAKRRGLPLIGLGSLYMYKQFTNALGGLL